MRFFQLFFRLVHWNCLILRLSTNWSLRPQESRMSVCSYVLLSVRDAFFGNRSLLFSETLQLVRACKREKNVTNIFLIIFTFLAKNCPKLAIWLDAGFWQDAGIAGNPRKTLKQVFLKSILSKLHSYFGKQPVHILKSPTPEFFFP